LTFEQGQKIGKRTILETSYRAGYSSTKGEQAVRIPCDLCDGSREMLARTLRRWIVRGTSWLCEACRKREKRDWNNDYRAGQSKDALCTRLGAHAVESHRVASGQKTRIVYLTVKCADCLGSFEEINRSLRAMETKGDGKIRCKACRKKRKGNGLTRARKAKREQPEPIWKSAVLKEVAELSQQQRQELIAGYQAWRSANQKLRIRITQREVKEYLQDYLSLMKTEAADPDVERLASMKSPKVTHFQRLDQYMSGILTI